MVTIVVRCDVLSTESGVVLMRMRNDLPGGHNETGEIKRARAEPEQSRAAANHDKHSCVSTTRIYPAGKQRAMTKV
jgi:hypothetical protein